MKSIFKYPLEITDVVDIEMPVGSIVCHVNTQRGKAFIWAEVDTNKPVEQRRFYVYGTGNPMIERHQIYLGTFFQSAFVWHLYEDA